MKNFTFSLLPALFSILFFGQSISPDQPIPEPKEEVTEIEEIQTFSLFEVNEDIALRSSELRNGVYLDLSKKQLSTIHQQQPKQINMILPTEEEDIQLVLRKHQILTDDFVATVKSSDGSVRRYDYNPGTYYTGTVAGDNNSVVTISIYEDNVMGVLSFGNQNYNLGKMSQGSKDPNATYVLFKERDLINPPSHACGVPASETMESDMTVKKSTVASKKGNVVKVYIECDSDMYADNNSSVSETMDKTTAIFNEVATLYGNEQILTQISEIVVWDSTDPYPISSSNAALDAFRNQVGGTFNGDIAHLISTAPGNNGGLAALDILCFKSRGHAYSNIANNFSLVPTFSWTVEVFTHEMGHNLGSPHTQSCRWGSSGNEALDDCYPTEGGCAPGPTPTNGGTIMSYCHLAAPKINFANGFGVEPGNLIRSKVADALCLEERFDCFSKIVLEPGVTFQGTTTDGAAQEFEDYSCSPVKHRGPEIAHVFSANVPGWAYLTYTENAPEQLDLFLNTACAPDSCTKMWAGAPLVQDSFFVNAGEEYIFIVDVVEDAPGGAYTLRISFPNADCNTSTTLTEGIMYTGSTATGTANTIDYSCGSERYLGNEVGHIYTATETGKVYIYYNETNSSQLDLILLDDCDRNTCQKTWTGGPNVRDSLDVVAGKGYFFFVDVKEDELGGQYNLLISSPGSGCGTTIALDNGVQYDGNSSDGVANFINYSCGGGAQSGNEVGHFFIHPEDARARVQFKDVNNAGFNVYLANSCHPDSCFQTWTGDFDEEIDIIALQGYYFIVDKPTAAGDDDYELTVTIEPRENTCFCFDPNEPEICENFESYFAGGISDQSDCWNFGTDTQEGYIDVGNAISGENALKIEGGRSTYFDLGNRTTGKYILKFKQKVTLGKEAFWRVYHKFDPNDPASNQVAFDIEQTITNNEPFAKLYAGKTNGSNATFAYTPNWEDFVLILDLDENTAEMTYRNLRIFSWTFNNTRNGTGGLPILAGIEFYNDGNETDYLIDNIQFLDNSSKYCDQSGALYCDDFDSVPDGQIVANGSTWSLMDLPNGALGANASSQNSASGLNSCRIRAGNPNFAWDDIVNDFGVFDQGRIKYSFRFYVPLGNTGHFRSLHTFAQNDMADEIIGNTVYLRRDGQGVVVSGGESYVFQYTRDSWVEYVQIVDFANDETSIFIEGAAVATYPFSNTLTGAGSNKKWAGFNFSTTSLVTDPDPLNEVNAGEQDRFTWMFIDNVEIFDLDLFLTANPEVIYAPSTAGSEMVSVESNIASWTAEEDVNWLNLQNPNGDFDGDFNVSWTENRSIESRGHDVLVKGLGVAPKPIRVIQSGADPFMTVSPDGTIDVPADEGTLPFNVSSNVLWNVVSSDTSWLRVKGATGGSDDGPFEIEYDINIGAERLDTITVEGNPAGDVVILIKQEEAGPTLVVRQDTICVDGRPGDVDFEVLANVNWTINNSNSWFSMDKNSGSTAEIVNITYEENPTTSDRFATFTLTGAGVPDETVVLKQTPVPAFLEADPLNINLTQPSGSLTFDILSNVNWNATENASWFTIDNSDQVNNSGPGEIKIDYEENTTPDQRIDTIFISGDAGVADIIVIVRQEGAGRLLSTSVINIVLPPTAGDTTIDILSNIDWRAQTVDGWLLVNGSGDYRGTLDETLDITYQANQSTGTRIGTILLTGSGVSSITVNIEQRALSAFLDVTPCDTTVSDAAGSFDLMINSNLTWMIDDDASWLGTSRFNGSGSSVVNVTYPANTAPTNRTATITLTPVGNPSVAPKIITIVQTGAGFIFSADRDTICVGPGLSANEEVNVTAASFAWTISDNVAWMQQDKSTLFGSNSFKVQITANAGGDVRYGTIFLEAPGGVTLEVVVKQTGSNPVLDASPKSIPVTAPAGNESFSITGNVTWTATSNDAWINGLDPMTGTGNGAVSFDYDANPTTNSRTGTITLSSTSGAAPITIEVIQDGGASTLSVTPTMINVTAPFGNEGFAINSSGAWTITSNDSWLKDLSATSGSDDSNINFNYEENTSTTSRTGTITVELTGAGISETVTVVQDGAAGNLVVNPTDISLPSGPNGTESFEIFSNKDWTITENSGGWILLQNAVGSGDETVDFNYLTNNDLAPRTATITVSCPGSPDATILVTQMGQAVNFLVDQSRFNAPATLGLVTAELTANVDWQITVNDFWLSANPLSGATNASISIGHQANADVTPRTGTILIEDLVTGQEIVITVEQAGTGPSFLVDKTEINFTQPGGSDNFEIASNLTWTLTASDSWFTVSPESGSNTEQIMVTAIANPDFTARTGTITASAAGQTDLIITVNQEALIRNISVDQTMIPADQLAGTGSFDITSNADWTVKTTAPWITLAPPTMGTGDANVSFSYDENTNLLQRTGVITVCVTGLPDTEITVTQAGISGVLTVSPQLLPVGWEAGSSSFEITSNSDWTVKTDDDWIFMNPFSGNGNTTINVNYLENPDMTPRTGIITVCSPGLPDQTVTVSQGAAVAPELVASRTLLNVAAAGGNVTFAVTSNIDWEINKDASSWFRTTPNSGTVTNGDLTVNVNVDLNVGAARSGVITLSGVGVPDIQITVEQEGVNFFLDVNTTDINLTAPAGMSSFDIMANVDWQVSTDASAWITLPSTTTGTGSETFEFDYLENTDLMSRTGTITIRGLNGVADQVIRVEQAGLNAMLDVSTMTIDLPETAGSDGFDIISNIAWEVVESPSWIFGYNLPSNLSGMGDMAVTFNYDANPTANPRTGIIKIAGSGLERSITVEQEAPSVFLEVNPERINLDAPAGNSAFSILSNVDWDVTVPASATWITAASATSGTGNGNYGFGYTENTGTSVRSAILTVTGNGVPVKTVEVFQQGTIAAYLDLDQTNLTKSNLAGTQVYNVSSNVAWSASSDATWLRLVPTDPSGNGDGLFVAQWSANSTTSTRTATITVIGAGVSDEVVTITQEAFSPMLSADPLVFDVGNFQGFVEFNISSNLTWSINADVPWVTMSNDFGSNNTLIRVDYETNQNPSFRTANLTISGGGAADVTVIINQDASTDATDLELIYDLSLYPNPVSSDFTVDFTLPSGENLTVDMIDLTGKVISRLSDDFFSAGENQLRGNVSDLAPGMYLLRFKSEKGILTKRFIVSK